MLRLLITLALSLISLPLMAAQPGPVGNQSGGMF